MSGNRKKNSKKAKSTDDPEVFQVQSLKLQPNKINRTNSAKSDDTLYKFRKGNETEPKTCLVKKFNVMALNNEGENVASTSSLKKDEEIPLVMEYCPEEVPESFAATYKFTKNTKSIKFTNQVTVLYFNGEDILCESTEPLKKEQEQQLRNKEMRKEHLLNKGQVDNLYLF